MTNAFVRERGDSINKRGVGPTLEPFKSIRTPRVETQAYSDGPDAESFAIDVALRRDPLATMLASYLDLSETQGPLHAAGIQVAYSNAVRPDPEPIWTQLAISPAFRPLLAAQLGIPGLNVVDPRDAPREFRSPKWIQMIELIDEFDGLSGIQKCGVARLCAKLGFYHFVLQLVPDGNLTRALEDPHGALLAYIRAAARATLSLSYNVLTPNSTIRYSPNDLIAIAEQAPAGTRAPFSAAVRLCVYFGKTLRNQEAVEHFSNLARSRYRELEPNLSPSARGMLRCVLIRAASFADLLRGDATSVTRALDEIEETSRKMLEDSGLSPVLTIDNLSTLLETRYREALWIGDRELAEMRLRESLALNPLDSVRHLEFGQFLVSQDKLDAAVDQFIIAGDLGPPASPIAYFLAGQIYEFQDDCVAAAHMYSLSLHLDPGAICAIRRLRRLGRCIEHAPVTTLYRQATDQMLQHLTDLPNNSDGLARGDVL